MAALQTHLLSGDAGLNAAYMKWKYVENPFGHQSFIQLALSEGRIAAMRGMFGTLWEVDDASRRYVLPYADDFVALPAHRNRGAAGLVMKACLAQAVSRGFAAAISLSASPVTFVSSLAAGWRPAGSYGLVRRRARWSRSLASFDKLDKMDRARRMPGTLSSSREPRPEEMAALVAALPWDGRIRHVRSAEYFAWRFRNPVHEYRFLFWGEGRLDGYLVLQRYLADRADHGRVNIVDWEARDAAGLAALLDAAVRYGRFARLETWSRALDESRRELLRRQGFEPVEASGVKQGSGGLLVHGLRSGSDLRLGRRGLATIADWDLRMLYSMAG